MSAKVATGAYAPRRSQNVPSNLTQPDGEIWQEKLAVCEGTTPSGEPKLIIRSYYRNDRSGDRVWDEPPSGAGTVLHATSEMRKRAEMQKEELHLTLDMIPPEDEEADDTNNMMKGGQGKKGFLGRFRKKNKPKKEVETSKDLNLQRAIARSIADQVYMPTDEPIVLYDEDFDDKRINLSVVDDDEDIALAKALSMSEAASAPVIVDTVSEEEMFQRALEQSRKHAKYGAATGVASIPTIVEDESVTSLSMVTNPHFIGKRDPNERSFCESENDTNAKSTSFKRQVDP